MAGPKVFVAGPSVSPNFGSPSQFLGNIQRLNTARRANTARKNELEQNKIFQDATSALNLRKQDFTEAAPQRAEDLRIANLGRETEKVQTLSGMAEGAAFAGGDRFTGLEDELSKDARYNALDDNGKLAARNKYIQDNPSALTSPKKFADILRKSMGGSGLYTGAEIDTAVANETARRYPTADKDLIKAQLLKPKDLLAAGGTTNNLVFGASGSTRAGSPSFSLLSGQVGQPNKDEMVNAEFESLGLTDKRTATTFGITHDDAGLPFGKPNVTQQNYNQILAKMERRGVSTPASIAALRSAIDGNLESEIDFSKPTKAQLDSLVTIAEANERQQTQVFNKKGGDISNAGQAAAGGRILTPSDAVAAASKHNQALLSRLTPGALSDQDVVSSFLDQLGAAAPAQTTSRQGGDQGGQVLAPAVTPPVVGDQGQGTADDFQPGIDGVRPGPGGNIDQGLEDFDGPPGQDTQVFPQPEQVAPVSQRPDSILQSQVKAASDRLTIFGNGTPADIALIKKGNKELKLRASAERIEEISTELKNMPRPDQRTLAQTAYARSLEKELKDLKR